ncbi:MAG: hypothetical protein L3J93_04210 [Thermoplasmata archaeon]|nr:hypothetical protein [Thermoplasmata archaeon]
MVVEFKLKRSAGGRFATLSRAGGWKEDNLRSEFRTLVRWANENRLRTGRWMFLHPSERRWTAALEIRGTANPSGAIRLRTLPAESVASVVFDPAVVSPGIVYHGLNDWLRWRKKDKTIRRVVTSREVYSGDPWTKPAAWAHADVQYVVRR